MYNFDKTNMRDLSRGLNKVNYNFKFSDQLPNNLDMRKGSSKCTKIQCATAMLEQLSATTGVDFSKYRTDSLRPNGESPIFSKKSLSPLMNPIPSSVFNYRKGVYEDTLTADNLLTLTNSQSSMQKKTSNVL